MSVDHDILRATPVHTRVQSPLEQHPFLLLCCPRCCHPGEFDERAKSPVSRAVSRTSGVRPRGFEPLTFGSVDRRSIQLSYGRKAGESIAAILAPDEPRDTTAEA